MDPFARSVFRDDPRLAEVDLARDFFHERLGTRDDGGDLKGTLEKSLKKQGAHRKGEIVGCRFPLVQSRCGRAARRSFALIYPVVRLSLRTGGGKTLNEGLTLTIKVIIL